jgi:hypothetical protein
MRRKVNLDKIKKIEIEAVLDGKVNPSFSLALQGLLKSFNDEHLPPGKWTLVQDYVRTLKALQKICTLATSNDKAVIVINRLQAEQTILSTLPLFVQSESFDGFEPATQEVRAQEARLIDAAEELSKFNRAMKVEGACFEDFYRAKQNLKYSQESDLILKAADTNLDVELFSQSGTIKIAACRRELQCLPSRHQHVFHCLVRRCEEKLGSTLFQLDVVDRVSPVESVIPAYSLLTASVLDPETRANLIEALKLKQQLKLECNLLEVPLVTELNESIPIEVLNAEFIF